MWRRSERDELRIRSAGDGVGCAFVVFRFKRLADDAFLDDALLDVYNLVVFRVGEVGGCEEAV